MLLLEEACVHLIYLSAFVFLNVVHLSLDSILALEKLFVLVFEVDEAASELLDAHVLVVVFVLFALYDVLEELGVLAQVAELSLSVFKKQFFLLDALLQLLDRLLVLEGCRVELL